MTIQHLEDILATDVTPKDIFLRVNQALRWSRWSYWDNHTERLGREDRKETVQAAMGPGPNIWSQVASGMLGCRIWSACAWGSEEGSQTCFWQVGPLHLHSCCSRAGGTVNVKGQAESPELSQPVSLLSLPVSSAAQQQNMQTETMVMSPGTEKYCFRVIKNYEMKICRKQHGDLAQRIWGFVILNSEILKEVLIILSKQLVSREIDVSSQGKIENKSWGPEGQLSG